MIYTFGDGFASGHIWPEWPQFLDSIIPPVRNFGHIGAGNEYIFNCAVKSASTANKDDIFLVQWASPFRYDKIIQDNQWDELQKSDPVYKDINSTVFKQKWWATSGSKLKEIEYYQDFYIQSEQYVNRSVLYMIALSKMLDSLDIKHRYFLTYEFDYSAHENYQDIKKLPWIDFDKGMEEWSRQFDDRGQEIQPSPQIHLRWVLLKILPSLNINIDQEKILNLVDNYKFNAYDPDRNQQWLNLKHEINLLLK